MDDLAPEDLDSSSYVLLDFLNRRNDNALDSLCNPDRVVGAGDGHLVHHVWLCSHLVNHGDSDGVDPRNPGTSDRLTGYVLKMRDSHSYND